jgi:hypothetical protein
MPAQETSAAASTVVEDTVVNLLLPLFIDTAGGDHDLARAMIRDQIASYEPRSAADVLRIGRIVGLRMSAVDNLRLSMTLNQDTQSCWRMAASLSKEADQMVRSFNEDRRTPRPLAAGVR